LDFRGFGSQRLAGPDDTPDGQALNRRVEFVIVAQGAQEAPNAGQPQPQQPNERPRRRRRARP